MNDIGCAHSLSYRKWLWIAIFAVFIVVHTPKDKIRIICEHGVGFVSEKSKSIENIIGDKDQMVLNLTKFAIHIKKLVFIISMVILLIPLTNSLKRASFLWDPKNLRKRFIRSGIVFLLLSILVFPMELSGYGWQYAKMSLSPFAMNSGWLYRRLLNPAIAYFFGFQGRFLFYVLSLGIVFVLIYLIMAYFEFEEVEVNLIDILSIMTCSFVILNFMSQGFPDPLMFIMFLIALIATDSYESRLAVITLALLVHEASVFIIGPIILFFFPKKDAFKCFLVIAIYFGLFLLSYLVNFEEFMKTYIVLNNKSAFDWIMEYPIREIGGWIASYKLLWIVIIYGMLKMFKSNDLNRALFVVCMVIISPVVMNLMTFDVSRHTGWGALALLMSYSYLRKSGYGKKAFLKFVMFVNILIPSIFVGTNAGFRPPADFGLYPWLYKITGLQRFLSGF